MKESGLVRDADERRWLLKHLDKRITASQERMDEAERIRDSHINRYRVASYPDLMTEQVKVLAKKFGVTPQVVRNIRYMIRRGY